jgi:hypothetical protein
MFSTAEVKTYLLDAWPDLDGDKRLIKLRCYVNPISYELAQEVDPEIASTLFHKLGPDMAPRSHLSHCRFVSNIGPQSLEYCRDPKHANSRVFIPAVSISKLEAGKVTPESNDFALMFTVSFEKSDPKVLNDLSDLLHEHFYCTFAELQPGLFDEHEAVMDLRCRLCDGANPEWATSDNKFAYCNIHSANIQEGERLKRIRDTAKPEMIADEMGREPGDEEPEPRVDPLAEEADFNARNRQGRRKRAAK